MKNLERAVRVYCAITESPMQVSSAGARDWATVRDALAHSGGLLMEMESLKPHVRERVLAYVCELSPLNEGVGVPAYTFGDEQAAARFVNEVTRAGGHASYLDGGTIVSADIDGMDEVVDAAAASQGGTRFNGPNLQEEYARVDVALPEALMTSGMDPAQVEEALIQAIYASSDPFAPRRLHESAWVGLDSKSHISKFKGRLEQFCKPKPVLGVSAHLAEAVRVSGLVTSPHLMSILEAGGGVSPADSTGADDENRFDRGGVAKDQPDSRQGNPAGSQPGEQEAPPAPTEHVPAQEQGAAGAITLANGMQVPQEVIAQALGKMLQNLATQVQQGVPQNGVPQKGPGTQPPAVQAVQQQGASQVEVGAQSDQQQPAGQSAQPEGTTPDPTDAAAPGEAPPADQAAAPGEAPQDPNAAQGATQPPQDPNAAPQPDPAIDQLIQSAQQGDQEALKRAQSMQGSMTDEQKQLLQQILSQQNGAQVAAPAPPAAPPQQESRRGRPRAVALGEATIYPMNPVTKAIIDKPLGLSWAEDGQLLYALRANKVLTGSKSGAAQAGISNELRKRGYSMREIADILGEAVGAVVGGAAKVLGKGAVKSAEKKVQTKIGMSEEALDEMRSQRKFNGPAAVKNVKNFLRFARGQMQEAAQSDGDSKSRSNAGNLARQLDPIIAKVDRLRPPQGVEIEAYVNPNSPTDMWGKVSDDGGDLLRAASRSISDAGNMLSRLGWKVEAVADTKTAQDYFALAAELLHGRLGDSIDRAADRWAFGLGEGQRGKPQHGQSANRVSKFTGKTSSDRDAKGKARHSRPQAGGGRKGNSSDYGFNKSVRKEPMSETVYGVTHRGRGTSVWEPLDAATSWPGATLPEGVDYGSGEADPGTPVMVLESGPTTSLLVLPSGDKIRCANEHVELADFHVMEGGEMVKSANISKLMEGIKDVVIVVGSPASGKSHYLRSAIGPAIRESVTDLPHVLEGLVNEDCIIEAAQIMTAWERALNEDADCDQEQANAAADEAVGRAARRLFYDRRNEAVIQIGETLVIDCASIDPRATNFSAILEACAGCDVLLTDFRTPLTVAQTRNGMREDAASRSDLVRNHNAARRVVNELWADPRVTRRASYEWIGEDALDGEYVTEGTQTKGAGPREKRQIGARTTYDIDGDDPKDPTTRKQIVTTESLTEGYVPEAAPKTINESPSYMQDPERKFYQGIERVRNMLRSDSPMGDFRARYKGDLSHLVFLYQYHGPGMSNTLGKAIEDFIRDLRSEGGFARAAEREAAKLPKLAALADAARDAWNARHESIDEQLDVGQAAEGDSTAKAMQETGVELKKAREAIFKLTTASLVQVSSMAKAAGMKRTAGAAEAAMNAASSLLDDLQKVGQLLDKTNEVMKGENNGRGGDTVDPMGGGATAPAVNTGPGQDVVVNAADTAAPPPVAPIPTPEAVESAAVASLLESEVVSMIQEGAHHSELNEALEARHPELDARQRARVIARLESIARVPEGADIQVSMGPRDREVLTEAVTHGSLSSGLLDRLSTGQTLASRAELEETVKALEKHGGVRQRLLAKTLGADTSDVSS